MYKIPGKMRVAVLLSAAMILLLAFSAVSYAEGGGRYLSNDAWSFGVHGDTQWTLGIPGFDFDPLALEDDPAGNNPWFVSLSISDQIDVEMIAHEVKFVIQMGDLTNWAGAEAIAARAEGAQDLYDAGIGFFPMRGNHETYGSFWAGFGLVDLDPDHTYSIPEIQENFPQTRGLGGNTFGAYNFSSPVIGPDGNDLDGISYSFDYDNTRFVIVDPWATENLIFVHPSLYVYYGYPFQDQQAWIDERLSTRNTKKTHAIVLSHQNILGQNHEDTPFGGYPDEFLPEQQVFWDSLQENNVHYYLSGHDHLFNRSILTSPDGSSKVEELIAQSASTKFYTPEDPSDPMWGGQKYRETQLSQELNNVGYYVYTVDGPRMNVDYYADETGGLLSDSNYPYDGSKITPEFTFVKVESWGYSLNGQEFLVAQGESYAGIMDSFQGTDAQILAGTNNSMATDFNAIPFTKAVNTGWVSRSVDPHTLISDILSLWGMADFGTEQTDVYVLSMKHDFRKELRNGTAGIASLNSEGDWVNAVDLNIGPSTKEYVYGPYVPGYGLGTYGVDPETKTAWAVIDYNADFAIAKFE